MFVRVWLILGLTVFFLSCSNNEHLSNAKMSGNVSSNQAHNSKNSDKINSPVKVIGAFSNGGGNGEHEWGYRVYIWKHNENLVGMLLGSAGTRLVGDPPTGVLENIVYDSHTGKISFRATLPRVEYEFKGTLSQKELTGELFSSLGKTTEKVVLLKSQEWTTEMMDEYPSLDAWEKRMDRLIELRGVKKTLK